MIIAANLKCNHTRASFESYANELESFLASNEPKEQMPELIVAPPASAFKYGVKGFCQAAQNFYPASAGSFTGEIGADMLAEFGIDCVIIGHSERRALGESEELLRAKFDFAKKQGYKVIYCIGESLSEYEAGLSAKVLQSQASNIELDYENLVLAYEPIFSIGSGVSASLEHINAMLLNLKKLTNAPLLYGGSVNISNIADIVFSPNCGGVLVGTASWEIDSFKALIKRALKI